MNYRTVEVMAYGALPATAGTWIEPIRIKDVISALEIEVGVPVGVGARLTHGLEAISRIDIVDGSDVLLSLSGGQLDGMHWFDIGKEACTFFTNDPSITDHMFTSVKFGRYLWDEELAFDPTKFMNPQIRVTYNTALVGTASTPMLLGIKAECFDEKVVSPIGFLQDREFNRFTPVTATYHYISLPTDLVVRKLIIQPYLPGSTCTLIADDWRLDEDNLKRVVFDLTAHQTNALNERIYGVMRVGFFTYKSGAGFPIFVSPTWGGLCQVVDYSAATPIQVLSVAAGRITLTVAPTTDLVMGEHRGSNPYGMMVYPFGKQNVIEDWYDVSKVGELRLRIHGGTAVPALATTRILLQQLRRY